jgi:uncharacterized protein YceK
LVLPRKEEKLSQVRLKLILLVGLFLQLQTGCATVISGTTQSIYIDTPKMEGAECKLTDSNGKSWHLDSTPGNIEVSKGDGPINLTCEKEGYEKVALMLGESVTGDLWGNLLLGGGIGVVVDAASGAAQVYPNTLIIWMRPNKWGSTEEEAIWLKERNAYENLINEINEKEKSGPTNPQGNQE